MLRAPDRYALAIEGGGVLGLHEYDNPACVKIAPETDVQRNFVSCSQGDNIEQMTQMCRGDSRHALQFFDSRGVGRERPVALRGAVRHGWDVTAGARRAVLPGDQPTLW